MKWLLVVYINWMFPPCCWEAKLSGLHLHTFMLLIHGLVFCSEQVRNLAFHAGTVLCDHITANTVKRIKHLDCKISDHFTLITVRNRTLKQRVFFTNMSCCKCFHNYYRNFMSHFSYFILLFLITNNDASTSLWQHNWYS